MWLPSSHPRWLCSFTSPEYEPPKSADDARYGPLTFSFKSGASGNYRFWAQVKVGEDREESFIPFDLKI